MRMPYFEAARDNLAAAQSALGAVAGTARLRWCHPFGDIDGAANFSARVVAPLSAALHICRTVARRAERLAVALAADEPINPAAVTYLNRLSDWFFVAARMANDQGRKDVLWVPGANR